MNRHASAEPHVDARCKLQVIVDLLEHDLSGEPALTLSNDGLLGLQAILRDCVADLGGEADGELAQDGVR